MDTLAPVLICTLNRYDHFKNCVTSLSNCKYASDTKLYIALDYPGNEIHWFGYLKIKEYLTTITGFYEIEVIYREQNYGAKRNFDDAIEKIFRTHDFLILSEDDNEFSIDFLEYMNGSRFAYEKRDDIFAICGYGYQISRPIDYKEPVYIWTGFSGWGAGIWKDKWIKIKWDFNHILNSFNYLTRKPIKMLGISKLAQIYVVSIFNQIVSNMIHGDIVISMHLYENSLRCIFPFTSKVRNLGHDGSGINCLSEDGEVYSKQKISDGRTINRYPPNIQENKEVYSELSKHFKLKKNNIFFVYLKFHVKQIMKGEL
jgi:hypothetical protein